jgi:hypothetical protein
VRLERAVERLRDLLGEPLLDLPRQE